VQVTAAVRLLLLSFCVWVQRLAILFLGAGTAVRALLRTDSMSSCLYQLPLAQPVPLYSAHPTCAPAAVTCAAAGPVPRLSQGLVWAHRSPACGCGC
jgi:hypothetical protein